MERFVVNPHYNRIPRWFFIFFDYMVQNSGNNILQGGSRMHNLNPTTLEIKKLREALENALFDIKGLRVVNQRLRKENRTYWSIIKKCYSRGGFR
jgi:hypothetical protein